MPTEVALRAVFLMLGTVLTYALVVAAAVVTLRFLGVRIPGAVLFSIVILPLVFLVPALIDGRTIAPVDHAGSLPPWRTPSTPTPRNPNLNDVATQMAAWAKAVRMAWKEGSLPLRNRWNGCGTHLAAGMQSAPFFPLTVLGFALPLAQAFNLFAAAKLFLALAGTWAWLTELQVSRLAALFGAVLFSLSMTMTPWLLFPHTSVICLWPWGFLAIERLRDPQFRLRAFVVLVAALVLWPLAGHIESVALGASFAGAWMLARWIFRGLPEWKPVVLYTTTAALLAVGLTAFLLLPHVLAIAASNRAVLAAKPFWAPHFSIRPHLPVWRGGLLTIFFPRLFGDAVSSPMIPGGAGSFPEMALGYFGVIGWACALLFLRPGSHRAPVEKAFVVVLFIGLGIAVGAWPFAEIVGLVPGLKMMFPLRFFSWAALAGAAVAALELDRWSKDWPGRRSPMAWLLASLLAIGLGAGGAYLSFRERHATAGGLGSQKMALVVTIGVLALAIAAVLVVRARNLNRTALAVSLTVIAAAELFYQGRRLYRSGPPAALYPSTGLIRYLQSKPRPFRVVGEGSVLFPNSNVFAGLEDVRTHDPLERRDYVEFLDAAAGYNPGDYFKHVANLNAPALDFLNVSYLVAGAGRGSPGPKWQLVYSGEDGTVFRSLGGVPRIFAPRQVQHLPGGENLRGHPRNVMKAFPGMVQNVMSTQDWRASAVVGGFDLADGESAGQRLNGDAEITEYHETTNAVTFRARVAAPGRSTILATSLAQDGGWSAFDGNGRRLPTAWVNGPFLAIGLEQGFHTVRLKYVPSGFRTGALISLLTVAVIAISVLWSARHRKATSAGPRV
jgi:hypothetical protein